MLLQALGGAAADVYMHSPRGSNNRLNEQNVNRDNNNRLFDSQNNNKGGYSVGVDDADYEDANIPTPDDGPAGYAQAPLVVQEGADLPIEWTPQHACGPNAKVKCDTIIQWLDDSATTAGATGGDADWPGTSPAAGRRLQDGTTGGVGGSVRLRDGEQTGCDDNNDQCPPLNNDNAINGDTNSAQYGNHEPVQYYLDCRQREQNQGLFTADQNLDGDEARFTRQNPNGGRSGTECAEERDYYPYWHPTPFKDIAVLTSDIAKCTFYQEQSQNVMNKGLCTNAAENNEDDCVAASGTWELKGAWGLPPPDCQEMFWTRDNHLGNAENGYAPVYNWSLPGVTGTAGSTLSAAMGGNADAVVIRVRYNITTEDVGDADVQSFDELDANYNGNQSPVQQDEGTEIGNAGVVDGAVDENGNPRTMQLALNTNQYFRTFEDRSYVLQLANEEGIARRRRLQADETGNPTSAEDCDEVHELHIRGKRGNIVQSYPSVEHDFLPQVLVAEVGDCVHFQMQLTDNDPPNNAGEGLPGSGRANIALQAVGDKNTPLEMFGEQSFFENEAQMFAFSYLNQEVLTRNNGNPSCLTENAIDNNNREQNVRNCGKLNPIGPSADSGYVKMRNAGTWEYMSTRENNFSNRGHKGQIIVTEKISNMEAVIVGVLLVVVAGIIVGSLYSAYKQGRIPGASNYKGASPAAGTSGPPTGHRRPPPGQHAPAAHRPPPRRGAPPVALLALLSIAFVIDCATADVYLHSPRGSNNRLNEQNVNRDNNNRLFDSQNNNKGGYTVGVDDDDYEGENIATPDNGEDGYRSPPVEAVEGTPLAMEWTNQHACGPNSVTQCEVVLQYITDSPGSTSAGNRRLQGAGVGTVGGNTLIRDGEQTGCDGNGDQCPPLNNDNAVTGNTDNSEYGNHEPVQWYLDCRARDRNKGLFTADQNVDDDATDTRQNPNGGRSGTECAEERDYYPYTNPTPWKDIAVLTSNISRCTLYQTESQNMVDKGVCTNAGENNEADCTNSGGQWVVTGAWGLDPPDCQEMLWTRDNHLGNGGVDGYPVYYNWTIPAPTGESANLGTGADKAVVRLRYNITTGDTGDIGVPYFDLDASANGGQSPVQQDEAVGVPGAADTADLDPGAGAVDQNGDTRTLQSAINTAQYGRIFEDRSFVIHIQSEQERRRRRMQTNRNDVEPDPDECSDIHNLHIRGKRGNIVQSYPGVEHDFLPQVLTAEVGDCIHLQLWLTDNDPPNNAGEGLPGTGRAAIGLMAAEDKNMPVTRFEDQNFFEHPETMFRWGFLGQEDINDNNGGEACLNENQIDDNNEEQNAANCAKLNPVGPYYDAGLKKLNTAGNWAYQSTRENNFSNRGHKGEIIVSEGSGKVELIILFVVVALVLGYIGYASVKSGKISMPRVAEGVPPVARPPPGTRAPPPGPHAPPPRP